VTLGFCEETEIRFYLDITKTNIAVIQASCAIVQEVTKNKNSNGI